VSMGAAQAKRLKTVKTFKVDVTISGLLDAGIIQPGPKWPAGYPSERVNFWVAVFVQKNPKDPESCLGEASAYLCGEDHPPHDLGINPHIAFEAVYLHEPMPWKRPFYGGPA